MAERRELRMVDGFAWIAGGNQWWTNLLVAACCAVALPVGGAARADEGMWLFNAPPRELLKTKYDFDASEPWLSHLQRAAVRFNSGGSGSFVSATGLVLTNHHVGADALHKLSSAEHDYVREGFFAKTAAEEMKCLDLELNVLVDIRDVTARVTSAVKPGMSLAEAEKARRAVINTIEQETSAKTGLRSDVITLYNGGMYQIYLYKKYTDVRLVFAPEHAIAFFGGDPDNFEYPRYDLDICFFRAYEDDQPAKIEHYLKWSATGAGDGELVFVAGNPGDTDRLKTVEHLKFLRDIDFPRSLELLFRREVLLKSFSDRSPENARRAGDELFGVQNFRKARVGGLAGLQDPRIIDVKRAAEEQLRAQFRSRQAEKQFADAEAAYAQVSKALAVWRSIYERKLLLEDGSAMDSRLFEIAREVLRYADETAKPNAERLREYRESNLESVRQELFSPAPIYDDLETLRMADGLARHMELAGPDDAIVVKMLAGQSPRDRAAQLVAGTKLGDVAVRKRLALGGPRAVQGSDDPMLALVRAIDPAAREVREKYQQQVDEPLRQAYGKIAQARFALSGQQIYPDATFTLRLAFGVVRGYQENNVELPPWTTIGGAFEHETKHDKLPPFVLPDSWHEAKDRLDLAVPLNFVSTADIIGGNSGSPVVNRAGEFVGIIFDGNIQSLVLDYVYTDRQSRALAVHSSSIVECLRSVYGADRVADELQPKAAAK
ncbi:MAG TPA: S46 family peptidase [Pirellulales bacterium]|nr:S46 family peptidase [Pirellulales bacterium]